MVGRKVMDREVDGGGVWEGRRGEGELEGRTHGWLESRQEDWAQLGLDFFLFPAGESKGETAGEKEGDAVRRSRRRERGRSRCREEKDVREGKIMRSGKEGRKKGRRWGI